MTAIEGQIGERLENDSHARREKPVGALEGQAVVAVVDGQLETVEARAEDDLQPRRRTNLILHIESRDRGIDVIIRAVGDKGDRPIDRCGADRDKDRGRPNRAGRENPVAALVATLLPAELEPREQGLIDPGNAVFPDQVGLRK